MTRQLPKILICDDDELVHLSVKYALRGTYEFKSARNGDEAVAILKTQRFDVLLLDIQMREATEGFRYLPVLRETAPEMSLAILSGRADFEAVREALRLGADDFLPKDFAPLELTLMLDRLLEKQRLARERSQRNLEAQLRQDEHILIGDSAPIQALRRTIAKVRESTLSVVIGGETGAGKEVAARLLRRKFPDGSWCPFVAVDSSTIQSSLAESLLFGHEKGAFTGATEQRKGLFEEANGGIIYFDEIGNMPLDIQAKLLRVLQEREVVRLGSTRPITLDFRVVCATNRDLEAMCAAGQFKHDLWQRLNVIPMQVPALRERIDDLPRLLEHFFARHAPGKPPLSILPEAMGALESYRWPGNIRELGNVAAYIATMTDAQTVGIGDLPEKLRRNARDGRDLETANPRDANVDASFYAQVSRFERRVLERACADSQENMSRLATRLGMDRSHLYSKLREFGLARANHRKSVRGSRR